MARQRKTFCWNRRSFGDLVNVPLDFRSYPISQNVSECSHSYTGRQGRKKSMLQRPQHKKCISSCLITVMSSNTVTYLGVLALRISH